MNLFNRPLGHDLVEVEEAGTPYTTQLRFADHLLVADEPVALGGANKGPSPMEVALGALGACTAITLRMYANRKGWAVDRLAVRVHQRVADDKVPEIVRDIRLSGALDAEQRARLLDIANKCPVHKLMTENKRVLTSLIGV